MKHFGTTYVLFAVLTVIEIEPVTADWLVMVDGSRVETREAWQVKNGQVVFTTRAGTLASLRLSEVDLEASEAATREALLPPPPPPPPVEARPVLVLTTADIGRGTPATPAGGDPGEQEAEEQAAAGRVISNTAVEVTSYETEPDIDINGYTLKGYVRNNGGEPVHSLRLEIELFDADQKSLARTVAQLGASFLRSGGTTSFRAVFQDTADFVGEPRFAFTGEEPPEVERLELRVVDGRDAEELFRATSSNDDSDGFGDDSVDDFSDDFSDEEGAEDDDEGQ